MQFIFLDFQLLATENIILEIKTKKILKTILYEILYPYQSCT